MQLIDSYLIDVERFLPVAQRADILGELRASLEEQVLDIAGDRAPDLADQKTVINRLGHPLKVASGYQGQRYLIGPELYPSFIQTLKIVLVIVAAIQLGIMLTAYVSSGWTTSVMGLLGSMFDSLLWASIIVCLVFVAIEYSGDRLDWYDKWSADSLSLNSGPSVDRGAMITNLISEGIFLLWWNDVLVLQNWIPGARDVFTVSLAEVWTPLHIPLNLLFGAWFLLHAFVLIRGIWHRAALGAEVLLGAMGIAVAAWLLRHRPLLDVSGDVGSNGELIIERVVLTVMIGVIAVTAWDMFQAIRRWRRLASAIR